MLLMIPTYIEIPVGSSNMCIPIFINNDMIAGNDESLLIIVMPVNPLDTVNQNTTLLIIDNNGSSNILNVLSFLTTIIASFCV